MLKIVFCCNPTASHYYFTISFERDESIKPDKQFVCISVNTAVIKKLTAARVDFNVRTSNN